MKYIFCILALLIQPVSAWCVYHKQDKREAALKMPMLFFSGAYLIIQMYVFVKFCMKFPEDYQMWSYLIQAAILAVFVILELSNITEQEQFKRKCDEIAKQLEIRKIKNTKERG